MSGKLARIGDNSLADLAARINAEHAAVTDFLKQSLDRAIRAGEMLMEAKGQLKHGRWLPWLSRACPDLPERTARLYMRLARHADEIRNSVADLGMRGAVALVQLIEHDVPELPEIMSESEILRRAQELRAELTEQRRAERIAKAITLSARDAPLPADRKYPLILADPPWRYDFSMTSTRAIEANYPTLPLEEICALPVSDLAAPTAVLFLWVPPAILEKAFVVIRAWGFSYCTGAIWAKDKIGAGFYFRQRHEHLLVATRGDMPAPPPAARSDSIIEAPRREHSEKPVEAYEIIEAMYPELPRIELFARHARKNWDRWGNEAPPDLDKPDDAKLLEGMKATADTKAHLEASRKREAASQWQFVYNKHDLAFVIEHHDDGWRVLDHAKRETVGTFATRELAIAFANARIAAPAAAPIAGERQHDRQQVKRIRKHQRDAQARRARSSHSQPRQRGRMPGSKTLLPAGNEPEGTGSRVTTGQDGDRQRQ